MELSLRRPVVLKKFLYREVDAGALKYVAYPTFTAQNSGSVRQRERDKSEASEWGANFRHHLSGRRHNFFVFRRIFNPGAAEKLPDSQSET